MTEQEAIAYIETYTWSATRLGLERTRELLSKLGDPQKKLKFIHITGSNGKGSTSAMLESVLRTSGYRTGFYLSPYLRDFKERIQVGGEHITPEALARITARVREAADGMADHPSQFELVTAIGMVYFLEMDCDVVILEVGMGGALDSTNVIDTPEAAVITNIGLEHTEYLGSTVEEIARTKAGIVKPGCHCVCYPGDPRALEVIAQVCGEKAVPMTVADLSRLTFLKGSLAGYSFLWDGVPHTLPLLGRHQLRNAATALTALEVLRGRGWNVPPQAVREGLAAVCWPARLEVLRREPLFLLDGGHNPQCAQALADFLEEGLVDTPIQLLLGVLADKNWQEMLTILSPYVKNVLCVTPQSPRALPGPELAAGVRELVDVPAACFPSPAAAVRAALESGEATVAFGSLYMAGEILDAFAD